MMNKSLDNTLLALMLALYDLESPLSDDEKAEFNDAAEELGALSDASKSNIEPTLLNIIQKNHALNEKFDNFKSRMEANQRDIPPELLPNSTEVARLYEQIFPTTLLSKGPKPKEEREQKTNEIHNIAMCILSSPTPQETVKQVKKFPQLKDFILPMF